MAAPRTLLAVLSIALVVPLLAGCTPDADKPVVDSPPAPVPTQTAEPAVEAAPTFVAPADCSALIGPALAADFEAKNIVLFDSTVGGGLYTGAGDHGPQQTGESTFYCLFGQDMVDLSSFQLEAQGLTQPAHEAVVSVLDGAGLVKSAEGDIVTYTQVGDDRGTPTIIHVLRPDSWMSAWSAFGGPQQVTLLTGYLDEIATQSYVG